VLVSDTTSQ